MPPASEEQQLLDTLRKIEALFTGTTFAGERDAAASAKERIQARLRKVQVEEAAVEYQFSMTDPWSRQLFLALLRRYGTTPYRYPGQRRTTVMARLPPRFVNETLWPEFRQIDDVLRAHLNAVSERIIKSAIFANHSDAETRAAPAQLLEPREGPSG